MKGRSLLFALAALIVACDARTPVWAAVAKASSGGAKGA